MASFFAPVHPVAGRICVGLDGVVGNEPSALMCPADLWLRDEKRALRRVMTSRREEMSADERARCAQAATDLLLDLPEVAAARVVAIRGACAVRTRFAGYRIHTSSKPAVHRRPLSLPLPASGERSAWRVSSPLPAS